MDVVVFVDPFEEFQKQKRERDVLEEEKEEVLRLGGTEDDRTTWTGKKVRGDGKVERDDGGRGVGKYLGAVVEKGDEEMDEAVGEWEEEVVEEPAKKKAKFGGGFGNFDSW